jgi:hypothetical protein
MHSLYTSQGIQLSVSPPPQHFLAAHDLESLGLTAKRIAPKHQALSSTNSKMKPKRRKEHKKKAEMGAELAYDVMFAAMEICPHGQYTLFHSENAVADDHTVSITFVRVFIASLRRSPHLSDY